MHLCCETALCTQQFLKSVSLAAEAVAGHTLGGYGSGSRSALDQDEGEDDLLPRPTADPTEPELALRLGFAEQVGFRSSCQVSEASAVGKRSFPFKLAPPICVTGACAFV